MNDEEVMVNLGIRAPRELKERLKRMAKGQRRKFSEAVRIALEDEVDKYESEIAMIEREALDAAHDKLVQRPAGDPSTARKLSR